MNKRENRTLRSIRSDKTVETHLNSEHHNINWGEMKDRQIKLKNNKLIDSVQEEHGIVQQVGVPFACQLDPLLPELVTYELHEILTTNMNISTHCHKFNKMLSKHVIY